jgi:hypothetical protein
MNAYPFTLLEFTTDADHKEARRICAREGYRDSWAYTTSSSIPGLFCLPIRNGQKQGIVVKTKEHGLMFIRDYSE